MIEKHVIIGSTSVVLPGVVLAEGSALGRFSLIKHSTEKWSINCGVPCKKYNNRSRDILELKRKFKEFLK